MAITAFFQSSNAANSAGTIIGDFDIWVARSAGDGWQVSMLDPNSYADDSDDGNPFIGWEQNSTTAVLVCWHSHSRLGLDQIKAAFSSGSVFVDLFFWPYFF